MKLDIKIQFDAADRIADALESIARSQRKLVKVLTPPSAAYIWFYVEEGGKLRRIKSMDLKVTDKLKVVIKAVDAFGNEAKLDGGAEFSLTDPAQGSLEVAEDGMSAILTPVGTLADFSVHASGDGDLGEGVKTIMGDLPVSLKAGDAVSISLAGEVIPAEVVVP